MLLFLTLFVFIVSATDQLNHCNFDNFSECATYCNCGWNTETQKCVVIEDNCESIFQLYQTITIICMILSFLALSTTILCLCFYLGDYYRKRKHYYYN